MNPLKMISLKDVRQEIGVGKTTLYKYLKKLSISTSKQFGVAHISSSDFEKIKAHVGIKSVDTSEQTPNDGERVRASADERGGQGRTDDGINSDKKGEKQDEQLRTSVNSVANDLEQELRNQIKELKAGNETKQQKIEGLTRDVGRWEGMTKVLQGRILELEAPKEQVPPTKAPQDTIILESEDLPKRAKKKGKKQKAMPRHDSDKDKKKGGKKGKPKKGKKKFLESIGDFFGG